MNWDTNNNTPIENIERMVKIMSKQNMNNHGNMKITCSNCKAEVVPKDLRVCKEHDDVVCNNCHVICIKCRESTCNECSSNGKCKSCQEEDKK